MSPSAASAWSSCWGTDYDVWTLAQRDAYRGQRGCARRQVLDVDFGVQARCHEGQADAARVQAGRATASTPTCAVSAVQGEMT